MFSEPSAVQSIGEVSKTTTSLTVSWTVDTDETVSGYRSEIKASGSSSSFRDREVTELTDTFNSLTPGQTYTVTITAFKNDHNSVKVYSSETNFEVTMGKQLNKILNSS